MVSSSEESAMIDRPQYESQVLDHLGLVAGMFDELGIGDILDQATQEDPQTRDLTVGEAVKAMVLNGLGFVNQALYLVPLFFQNKPTYRLISPRVAPEQLNDDALGRILDTLYSYGVTELYSLIAAGTAKRLGLTPTYGHLDSTSFHVDGHTTTVRCRLPRASCVSLRAIAATTGLISIKSCWISSWSIRLVSRC
jgi:transposase